MKNIFLTSDTHFGHDKSFLLSPRGYESWIDCGEAIVENWNSVIKPNDEVYHLGDVMLSQEHEEQSLSWINSLNGNIHLIIGNHDSDRRIKTLMERCRNMVSFEFAQRMRIDKINFFLSHFPMYTINDGHKEEKLYESIISLHGHTHQQNTFTEGLNNLYHVGMDSHNLTPVNIEQIISELKQRYNG